LLKVTLSVVDDKTESEDEEEDEIGITLQGSTSSESTSAIRRAEAAEEVDG
jgi:hypothetical protein